ncbi:MAG: alpha/beta hydrolase [Firmicutes bacterium HGW-Firmicutes-16]|nr:MAG: alpha/beta hydrolase [Firmicutes bacterium HGW-Firmicutes-16]
MTEHKKVESSNGVTHYWIGRNENKNAACIVFTHGVTANHIMFEKQIEFFSKDYTVITWDVPLHGISRPYKNFSFENTAKELKLILKVEQIAKVVLVGMSLGGYPSQEFALRYLEMVLGFVALDTTPYGLRYYSKFDRWCVRQVEPLAKWFPEKTLRKSMAKAVSKSQYSYDTMVKMLEPMSKAEIVQQMGIAYAGFLKENRDANFNFPVLILLGEYDKTGKVAQYSKAWAKKEGYPLHIIKNASHFSNGDNPDSVNGEISEFVEGL